MKQLFIIKTNAVKNGCFLSNEHVTVGRGLKLSFEHKKVSENLFLSARFCWDFRLFSRKMDHIFTLGGNFGCGDSYLEFFFRQFKLFKLHVLLYDAAGAKKALSGKGPGYCYVIGRKPISGLFRQVTRLLFCLYVNLFLPSICKSLDF